MSEEEILRNEDEAYLPFRISDCQCEIRSEELFNKETRAER